MPKPLKDRLNCVAKDCRCSAEYLAEVILRDALDQIEDPLMPDAVLLAVATMRRQAGKAVASAGDASAERLLHSLGLPPLSELVRAGYNALATEKITTLRVAEAPAPKSRRAAK
ncbi:MAG: hypothetical protein ABMA13_16070 [Chthoniobacteraceae bacterium]